jgi:hypothetical protein
MIVTTRKKLIIKKNAIRINNPIAIGWRRKLDRFLFNYNKSFGLPCFLPMIYLVNQLVVDNKPVYIGGMKNGWGEKIPIRPVIVSNHELTKCKEAAETGVFKVSNFEYNGIFSKALPGIADYVVTDAIQSTDPGCWKCICSDGKTRHIPGCYLSGIQIKMKPNTEDLIIFGPASKS